MDADAITRAYIENGEEGISLVMKEYGKPLLRYCYSILYDYHESQDAVQETFVKAYNSSGRFGGGMNLKAFLYKIAFNTCMSIIKKRRRFFIPRETARDGGYMSEAVEIALLSLSPLDRAILYSHAAEGVPLAELAGVYGRKAPALRKRYERAKRKLSDCLLREYSHINRKTEGAEK